ncbi:P-type conjugative transfer protein TrbJ [Sphingomonas sp. LaA6.9]|uniref:P-type conjugative transfer protein TrbJ n=1 Tax=Sphingomonas sp. LaA6.9 TaxID=2919914 RepID=UPI001F4F8BC5|nr:P-type conjugative transfer protein TrbJ [Sphingomonas sp. LaA6.9]MCJ8158888.1 P-type conjugative transfer protein TrbJ [Sphingomonas sp. LaA6.9]
MKPVIYAAFLATCGIAVPLALTEPAQAIPVFDSANYAQNLLIAARSLQQINQQIQSLQNEAAMLQAMTRNLSTIDFPELQALRRKLEEVDRLLGEAKGIDFRLDALERDYRKLFPESFERLAGSSERVREARLRFDTAMAGLRHTMGVQSVIVENIRSDAGALEAIVQRSQRAEGALQAGQATNQLLALAAKQQFQLQQLMAAQFRSDAIERAGRLQAQGEARAATRRFLGTGKAYAPD